MPIYMDVHYIPGIAAYDAAEAHQKDLNIQAHHHCKCMTYWVDEPRGVVFCLIDAPDKSTVEEMHRKAHGLVPNKILEVSNDIVESFLGRIHDPEDAVISPNGLKVFNDPAYRFLLVINAIDHVLLRYRLGQQASEILLFRQGQVVREAMFKHGGRMVEDRGGGWVASFGLASDAVACALDIDGRLPEAERKTSGLQIGISGGDPIAGGDRLFGDALQLGRRLSNVNANGRIAVSVAVKDLLAEDLYREHAGRLTALAPRDEELMGVLLDTLEKHWQDPDFGIESFCKIVAMSKSQLYRKFIDIWDTSPNCFLRHYRLNKARELLKKQPTSIAGATFDSGFTSPSYFSKCFKEMFGLLPAAYLEMV